MTQLTIRPLSVDLEDLWVNDESPLDDFDDGVDLTVVVPGFEELKNPDTTNILKLAVGRLRERTRATRSRGKMDVYITAEDFTEGPERDAFLLVFGSAWDLFEGTHQGRRKLALDFFFCASDQKITFDDTILALGEGLRPDLFRARLMLEFWLRERDQRAAGKPGLWLMPHLGFSARPLPEAFEQLVLSYCFDAAEEALAIAREVWLEPGVSEHVALNRAQGRMQRQISGWDRPSTLVFALELLISSHLVSPVGLIGEGNLFFTAKNPLLALGDTPEALARINQWWFREF